MTLVLAITAYAIALSKGVEVEIPWVPLIFAAGLFVYSVGYAFRSAYISVVSWSLCRLVLFSTAMAFMVDAVALNCEPVDYLLADLDAGLGLSAVGITQWFADHRMLSKVSMICYFSMIPQIMLAILWGYQGPQLMRRMVASGVATVLLFSLVPAYGSYVDSEPQTHNAPIKARMEALSSGQVDVLRLCECEGIVCAPSYHTICGVLLIAAMWGTPLRWWSLALNVGMIISTVPTGGHYVVDVLAGLLVALITLRFVK